MCTTCGLATHDLVQCVATGCWFCNSLTPDPLTGRLVSCIISYLLEDDRSVQPRISTHPHSRWGAHELACSVEVVDDIFSLGAVITTGNDNSTELWVLSKKAAATHAPRHIWHSFVRYERSGAPTSLVEWLVPSTGVIVSAVARRIAARAQSLQLPNASPLTYADAASHRSYFSALVTLVAEQDARSGSSFTSEGVAFRWEDGLRHEPVAYFHWNARSGERLELDDRVRVRSPSEASPSSLSDIAYGVVSYTDGDRIGVSFEVGDVDVDVSLGYSVQKARISVSYDRMQSALLAFAVDESIGSHLQRAILNPSDYDEAFSSVYLPLSYDVPGCPLTNPSQQSAIKLALTRTLSVVEGPPGTGKTQTLALIIYHLLSQPHIGQVLACSSSNVASTNLAEALYQLGVKVIRYFPSTRNESAAAHLRPELTIGHWVAPGTDLDQLQALRSKNPTSGLHAEHQSRLKSLQKRLYKKALDSVQVICCTCSASGDGQMLPRRFHTVVIDEAGQSIEPETLIPVSLGARRLCLVGDEKQLPPVVSCRAAQLGGLQRSLFERVKLAGAPCVLLDTQYRMHPSISAYPSRSFYDGRLRDGVTAADRERADVSFPWRSRTSRTLFWHHRSGNGLEESGGVDGTSKFNSVEAHSALLVAVALLKSGVQTSEVVIISMYEAQTRLLKQVASAHVPPLQLEIGNTDSLQGHQRAYVILTLVRSNAAGRVGFLSDPRRANVALTRARNGLVIVGDAVTVGQHEPWSSLIASYFSDGLVVVGPLEHLTPFPPPAGSPLARGFVTSAAANSHDVAAFAAAYRSPTMCNLLTTPSEERHSPLYAEATTSLWHLANNIRRASFQRDIACMRARISLLHRRCRDPYGGVTRGPPSRCRPGLR